MQQIALDYVFMWTTAFVNIILYIPLALVIKGVVVVEGWKFKLADKRDRLDVRSRTTEPSRGIDGIALQMFLYVSSITSSIFFFRRSRLTTRSSLAAILRYTL